MTGRIVVTGEVLNITASGGDRAYTSPRDRRLFPPITSTLPAVPLRRPHVRRVQMVDLPPPVPPDQGQRSPRMQLAAADVERDDGGAAVRSDRDILRREVQVLGAAAGMPRALRCEERRERRDDGRTP